MSRGAVLIVLGFLAAGVLYFVGLHLLRENLLPAAGECGQFDPSARDRCATALWLMGGGFLAAIILAIITIRHYRALHRKR